jgi:hypothetical protein
MSALLTCKSNSGLTSTEQVSLENDCLKPIRGLLVASIASGKDKFAQIAHKLRKCFKKNPSIEKKCHEINIPGWGDDLYQACHVGIDIDSAKIAALIAPTTVNGDCKLTDAIKTATAGDKCGKGTSIKIQDALDKFKKELKYNKNMKGSSQGSKMGWFDICMKKYLFPQLTSAQIQIFINITIPGFASMDQFLDTCAEYKSISSLSTIVLNGPPATCKLITSLKTGITQGANTTNTSTIQEANKFVTNCSNYFASQPDCTKRINFVSTQYSLLTEECRHFILTIQITGTYIPGLAGPFTFSDVISQQHLVTNKGGYNFSSDFSATGGYEQAFTVNPSCNCSEAEDNNNAYIKACNLTVAQITQYTP